jgi:lipopolysaccharide transport system permease protein
MPTLFEEIWNRRSLIILLAVNDVKTRYRNSVLGFFWSFLEPLLMLGVLYLVFTNIFKNSIENYPIYLLLGLIIWYMFSRATSMGQMSLLSKAGIIQKVNLRKELIVLSSCLASLIMMCFEFIAFTFFALVFHFIPASTILMLPLLILDLFVFCFGISLILSVLTVYFGDIKFIWHVALQVGFFTTPIFYQLEVFPESIKQMLQLNPMASVVDTAHKIVIYGTLPTLEESMHIVISTLVIFLIGYAIFRLKDKRLVEKI